MRRLFAPIFAAAMLASAPMAMAETTSGIVESVDMATMTLTLDDGTTFQLPADFDVASIAPGDQVEVTWEADASGAQVVTDVSPSS